MDLDALSKMTGVERMMLYMDQVEKREVTTNRYVKLAVKRCREDLKKKDWPYRFDEGKANKFIQFTECLKQYKDEFRGQPLILQPWQCFVFSNIYGWVHRDTGLRRFRKAFIFVSRKNGKTAMIASSLLYDVLTTPGAECYCVATKKEQSKICFEFVKQMVKQNPGLSKRLSVYESTSRIVNMANAGVVAALAADSNKMDGLNPSCVVVDECSAMKNYSIVKVMASGQGSRPEPLMLEITSGSDDMYSVGKQEFDRSKRILEGTEEDDSYFTVLYCIDEKDKWNDPKNFIKANPNMDVSIKSDWLNKQMKEAVQNPSLEGEFRTKNLGSFISPMHSWIQPKFWKKAMENRHVLDLSKPYYAVGAVDLSKRIDLTAFTTCVYQDGYYHLIHKAYFPEESMQEKMQKDNEMWRKWTDKGVLTATSGRTVDYRVLFKDIMDTHSKYGLDCVLFDPYNSTSLINELESEITLVEVPQNIKNLSPYAKSFEELIYQGMIVDSNPLMAWCMSNAEVYRDPNDNIKVSKPQDGTKRIDPVVTSLMCVGFIRSKLDNGEIDLRAPEQIAAETAAFLKSLKWGAAN